MKISLRSARVNVGLTAREVADKLEVAETTIWTWERGETIPPFDKVQELCSLYGIGIENLKLKEGK